MSFPGFHARRYCAGLSRFPFRVCLALASAATDAQADLLIPLLLGSVLLCHLCPSLLSCSSSLSDSKVLLAFHVSSLSGLIRPTVVNIKYI